MKIQVLPDGITLEVQEGKKLHDLLSEAGIHLTASCGGKGTCGRCVVEVVEGDLRQETGFGPKVKEGENIKSGQVLACKTAVHSDGIIHIPHDGRRLSSHKVLINEVQLDNPYNYEPLYRQIPIEMNQPTLAENTDDLTRFMIALRKKTGVEKVRLDLHSMSSLPTVLREGNWKLTVGLYKSSSYAEVIELTPGHDVERAYGLAIDIGTTTVKINLIDLADGRIVDSRGEYNRQQQYGDDVINRIVYASDEENGGEILRQAVLSSLNQLIDKILQSQGITENQIKTAVVAGNTTMTHLFMGIPAKWIRLEPYIPAAANPQYIKGNESGLRMNPRGMVLNLPAVGSYVGGDITSGVLSTQIARHEGLRLLIDIGTNGEIVLGNSDFQISCACSAGPCFEGGGIRCGMRAMAGAIDKIEIAPNGQILVNTIDDAKPSGICGSGLIDTMAVLLQAGIIDRQGNLRKENQVLSIKNFEEEGWGLVLVPAEESAHGQDIYILESDIKNLIRAKAAIYAGIRSLLKHMGMEMEMIEEILIAGGFGNALNIQDAITIGMLPDVELEKYRYVGNTAIKGAQFVLTSVKAYEEIMEFARGMTYLELSIGNDFMDEFISASFLPHTDLGQFPNVSLK